MSNINKIIENLTEKELIEFKKELKKKGYRLNKNNQILKRKNDKNNEKYIIGKSDERDSYNLSHAQKRLWLLDQLEEDCLAFNMPFSFILKGELDINLFQQAFSFIIERHESLRTIFIEENGEPKQKILENPEFDIDIIDLRNNLNAEGECQKLAEQDLFTPFNLVTGPLIRFSIIRIEDEKHLFLLNMHHIISDGWSMNVFIKEFLAIYLSHKERDIPDLEPLKIHYKDYSEWQNSLLESDEIDAQKKYWHEKLSGELPVLALPSDYTRPVSKTYNGNSISFSLSKEINTSINNLCRENKISLFMILQAFVKVLFYRYTGQTDLILGSPVAGRVHEDLENQIGFFINTLIFRDTISGDSSFTEILDSVRKTSSEAFDNQDYPFDCLVEDLDLKRDFSRSPLFDVMVVLQNNDNTKVEFEGLELIPYDNNNVVSKFDMTFSFTENEGQLFCGIEYNTDIYAENRIMRMSEHLKTLISSVIENPESKVKDLEIIPFDEKNLLLNVFNDTKTDYPRDKTIVDLFEEQVEMTPDNMAVVFEDVELTYRELNEKANIVGHYLRGHYILHPDDLVVVMLERSEMVIIAILGILKSGAAYVPIDPVYPVDRIEYMLKDSSPKVVLSERKDLSVNDNVILDINEVLQSDHSVANPVIITNPNSLAYVIYTSGSTGKPKGVLIEHQSVVNLVNSLNDLIYREYSVKVNISLFASFSFDASVKQLFCSLLLGHCLHIVPKETKQNMIQLLDFYEDKKIDIVDGTPVLIDLLNDRISEYSNRLKIEEFIIGGDAFHFSSIDKLLSNFSSHRPKITNVYGPTECCVDSSLYRFSGLDLINSKISPIGKPIANSTMLILDRHLNLIPIGVIGELFISGAGLARGYINNSELTAEKFIDNPYLPDERMYKTGDLARWFPEGNIEFLGRIDNQVKIRGFRIEPGEIENSLIQHNDIKEAIVVKNKVNDELCAYYTKVDESNNNRSSSLLYKAFSFKEMIDSNKELNRLLKSKNKIVADKTDQIAHEIFAQYDESTALSEKEKIRYKRQILLDGWGIESQEVLKGSTVFIAGAGGIGSPTIQQLALTGIGHLIICDYDHVELSNLNRQVLHDESRIGMNKALSAKLTVERINPNIKVTAVQEKITRDNIDIIASESIIIFDCVDDYETKFILSDYAVKKQIPHMLSVMMEINCYWAILHTPYTPCFYCLHDYQVLQQIEGIKKISTDYKKSANPVSSSALFISSGFVVNEAVKYLLDIDNLAYNKYFFVNQKGSTSLIETTGYKILSYTFSSHFKQLCKDQGFDWEIGWRGNFIEELDITHDDECIACKNIIIKEDKFEGKGERIIKYGLKDIEEINKVVLILDDSYELRLAILGALKANKIVIPIDPSVSESKSIEILSDCEARVVITDRSYIEHASNIVNKTNKRLKIINIDTIDMNSVDEELKTDLNPDRVSIIQYDTDSCLSSSLRKYLEKSLPDFMIPSFFIQLESFPLTPNGKVDRKALPEPDGTYNTGVEYVAPENEIQKKLVQIWQEVLGVEMIGIYDNFFELGGHSLKATRVVSIISRELEVNISLKDIFEKSTVESLSGLINVSVKNEYKQIEIILSQESYELSNAQRRLWVLDQFEKDSIAYNMPVAFILEGNLNTDTFRQAYSFMIERHESLRTVFITDNGDPKQKILMNPDFNIEIIDLRNSLDIEKEASVLAEKDLVAPFNLETGPLVRFTIIRLEDEKHLLLFNMHHIISDGWSMGIFINEFLTSYNSFNEGLTPELAPLRIHYKDYSVWQNGLLKSPGMDSQREYWLDKLSGELPVLDLPADNIRPINQTFNGNNSGFVLPGEINSSLNELCLENKVSLFMMLQALVKVLFYRYTGQEDIILGSPIAGRVHEDLEDQIGCYINTLCLRDTIEGGLIFKEFLASVKKTCTEAFDNQIYPFDCLVEELEIKRDLSRSPLFDVMVVLQNNETTEVEFDGLNLSPYSSGNTISKFDLTFNFSESDGSLFCGIEYNTDIYSVDRIERMGEHLNTLISSVLENPESRIKDFKIIPEEEKNLILNVFNDTKTVYPADKTIVDLFEEQVERIPDNIAVVFENVELTYKELNEKVNIVGHYLRDNYEIKPDDLVGVLLGRSERMIIALLGILKSGAAYVPLDPEYPVDRIEYMLKDSCPKVVLSERKDLSVVNDIEFLDINEVFESDHSLENPVTITNPNHLAYVIYTSGSTGKPKGVLVEHGGVSNTLSFLQKKYPLQTDDKYLLKTNYTFDVSVSELFGWILGKGQLVILFKDHEKDPGLIIDIINKKHITHINFVPSMLNEFISNITDEQKIKINSLRYIFVAGEVFNSGLVKKLDKLDDSISIENIYGPTEASIYASNFSLSKNKMYLSIPIGKPISNTRVYIIDKKNNPTPLGVPGELCISGAGLARGYLNRPELTAEKFVENPFVPEERIYRTGDLARWLPDGNIEFLGRIDNQVKLRGFRIELGEIENALVQHTEINSVVVEAKEAIDGDKQLITYFVSDKELKLTELRSFLKKSLPDYMIPSFFIHLESFPLTLNGKVDRKALPKPDGTLNTDVEYVAPKNEIQKKLVRIWQEVLGIEKVGILDNFFELGGHSLKATRVISQIMKELEVDIALKDIFESRTVETLFDFIENAKKKGYKQIEVVSEQEYYDVSNAQRRLWVLDQFEEDSITYNMSAAFILEGRLITDAFRQAYSFMIGRHESLRTVFVTDNGDPKQKILMNPDFDIEIIDLRNILDVEKEARVLAKKDLHTPFDLEVGPLVRFSIIRLEDEKYLLLFNMHHIISDGWSMGIFIEEFITSYNSLKDGTIPELTSLRIHYKDYSVWQNSLLDSSEMDNQREYWLDKLSGDLSVLDLPSDNIRPVNQTFNGNSIGFVLPEEINSSLNDLCLENKASLFMVLQALVKVLFHRYTGQEDIMLGSPIAGRNHDDLENQIGFYVNTLSLRDTIKGDLTFKEFLTSVKKTCTDAYDNQNYPFDSLVEDLDIKRDMSRSPLFDVVVALQNNEITAVEFDGLNLSPYNTENKISKFDMTFNFSESDGSLFCGIEYNTDIYSVDRIERMGEHLKTLISSVLENPESRIKDFKIIPEEEKNQILNVFNDTKTDYPADKTIVDLFEQQVEKTPDNSAVVFEDVKLTYRELNDKANIVGHYLRDNYNIESDDLVGVLLERSEKMIIGIWGILKSGAAYVPLDPEYPVNRIEYMLKDSCPKVVLSETKDLPVNDIEILDINEVLELNNNIENPRTITTPNNLAYVIYTSGSTGKPKGVMIENRNVINLSFWHIDEFELSQVDIVSQYASISFDASVWEIIPSLISGASVHVINQENRMNLDKLTSYFKKNLISVSFLPTPIYDEFQKRKNLELRVLLTGGDKLESYCANNYKLYNNYGPTENSAVSTSHRVENNSRNIPIGSPISNTTVYIIDKYNNPTPLGVPGELCISGDGLARGYLNRSELTAEKFVDNPFAPDQRMYRTGDLARWLPDGNIEFLGRIDNQVQIRGFRIELGEIENTLIQHAEISSVVVIAKEGVGGDKQLIAYFVSDKELELLMVRDFLRKSLPDYMIPSFFIHMETLPLTTNGKIDRKALPDVDGQVGSSVEYVAPENEIQEKLVRIWQEVLGVERIGVYDNFFELGGNSLRAISIMGLIGERLEVQVHLKIIFNNPTIITLASFLKDSDLKITELPELFSDKDSRFEAFPLTDVQQAYWIGRKGNFDLGGIGTHAYSEMFIDNIDIDKLNYSLNYLIQRHDMLRMVVTEDGQQRIIENVGEYTVKVLDLQGVSEQEELSDFYRLRDEFSHKVYNGEEWPLFDISITIFRDGTFKLHYSMDALIMDGFSGNIFFDEFIKIYTDNIETLPDLNVTFRDYIMTEQIIKESTLYKKSYDYWMSRIPLLPKAPEILFTKSPTEIVNPKFRRKSFFLNENLWKSLENKIISENLTPTIFFIEMFGLVINNWSRNNKFLFNLTLFNRIPLHEDINKIIGDFTSLTLLEMDYSEIKSISKQLYRTQNQLLDDLEHKYFSGIEVQREMSRVSGSTVSVPVVVTSILGQTMGDDNSSVIEDSDDLTEIQRDYSITQTSQVWLDFKIFDHQKGIGVDWDYVDDLFPTGMLDDMFDAFSNLIIHYANDSSDWNQPAINLIPKKQLETRESVNKTDGEVSEKFMHELFVDSVKRDPDKLAIRSNKKHLTYKELYDLSTAIGLELESAGAKPNELIAILMNKGWEQAVAVLGIQFSGAAYMPIDASLPIERINKLIKLGEVDKVVSVSSILNDIGLDQRIQAICIDDLEIINKQSIVSKKNQAVIDLAYVIFTSGSTGEPKGVMIDHRGAVNTILDINYRFNITEKDSCFALSSLCFDLSVYDIFGLLAAGGTIVIPEPDEDKDPKAWLRYLKEENVTVWNSVPALMQMLVEYAGESETDLGLKRVLLSGDWIPISLPGQIKGMNREVDVISLGGATEASIWSISYPIENVDPAWKSIPYGKPLQNQSFHVFKSRSLRMDLEHKDQHGLIDLADCPEWVTGDLYIGGTGLALGYWKDKYKTDSNFVNHPVTGERLYRTGDQGRYLPDGNIEFLGRIDNQIKIRGFRIEPGEIERTLLQYESITSAVVLATNRDNEDHGDSYLVAYYSMGKELENSEIRSFLKKSLPDYMIPSFFIHLESFPLTPNGKVDRKALPKPDGTLNTDVVYVAPKNEIQKKLVRIWQEVLGIEKVGILDNFFELGGHSLKATRVVSKSIKELEINIALKDIFENPTIKSLSDLIENAKNKAYNQIEVAPELESYELSNAQRRLWVLDQFEEDSIAYNMPAAFILEGEFNTDTFRQAYFFMIGRHESLRTVFVTEDGEPKQQVLKNPGFDIEIIDLRNCSDIEKEARVLAEKDLQTPFNLEVGPLVRFSFIRLEDEKYLLLFNMHHIISDGWSMGIFIKEFLTSYNSFKDGITPELTPLRIHYKDYSAWQNSLLDSSEMDSQREYWFDKLSGELPVLDLSTDKIRPVNQTFNGNSVGFILPEEINSSLNSLCFENKASLFMMLQTLVKVLFHRYTGQEDIILGSPIAGRNHDDLENQIGFYVNTLSLRDTIEGDLTFNEFLASVKKTCTDAYDNQNYPFDSLVEDLDLKRDMSRSPLFDVMVVLQNNESTAVEFEGLKLTPYENDDVVSKFDMTFIFFEGDEGLYCSIEYNTDIYSEDRIERMGEHFKTLISSVIENPESRIKDLEIIPAEEKKLLLNIFNDTKTDFPSDKTIVDLFEQQVEKNPDNTAVVFEDIELTYRELNERANIVGHYLRDNYQIKPDDLVGVLLERSERMIIALLGILKSGAAYVPLDPEYPKDRINYMLEDSSPKIVLSERKDLSVNDIEFLSINDVLQSGKSVENPMSITSSNHLAYVIYTSGSTGKPKGTLLENSGLINMSLNQIKEFGILESDIVLQFASTSFDASMSEIFMALFSGSSLAIPEDSIKKNISKFQDFILGKQVTVATLPPNFLGNLDNEIIKNLRVLITAGEKPNPIVVNDYSKHLKYINAFGPTEASVCISFYCVKSDSHILSEIPIGKPISNTQVYILDRNTKPTPLGVPGELCISGVGLARGYLNRPELTAEKFVDNPFVPGQRMYKTGDLVKWLPDGDIEFFGRIDNQVKIRGFRIELGEIEYTLNQIDVVDSAFVVAKDDPHGEKYLVAYYLVNNDKIKMEEIEKNSVACWQEVFQDSYSYDSLETDPEFDINSWINSYTGTPIEPSQMKEWVNSTVNRIQLTEPKNMYEIGCGSGLLLYRLAPDSISYCGTDYSDKIISKVEKVVNSIEIIKNKTRVFCKTADDFAEIPNKSLDTIVINSVAQYFPNMDYLSDVIDKSINALEKGGVLFLGDIRNYNLFELFHTSITLFQEDECIEVDKLKQKIGKSMEQETELLVSPEYFHYMKMHNSRISHVDIRYKKGEAHNELTKFRYDVLLHIEKSITKENITEISFDKNDFDVSKIPSILNNDAPDILYVTGVINSRIEKDYYEMLHLDDMNNSELFNTSIKHIEDKIIDSIEFEKVNPSGYIVELLWTGNGREQLYDVVYIKEKLVKGKYHGIIPNRDLEITIDDSVSNYANNPLITTSDGVVLYKIKETLKKLLPDYMIPSYFLHLDEIPLTLNGKIDRKSLPEINGSYTSSVEFVAPRNATEQTLVKIWHEILGFDKIGVLDNFFELGGHSLKATRVVSQIMKELEVDITLRDIFEFQTVEALSDLIEKANKKAYIQIEVAPEQEYYDVSNAQRRLWVLDQFEQKSIAYNMPAAFILEGKFNTDTFRQAFTFMIGRHESLRTVFVTEDGEPKQQVLKNPDFDIEIIDLRNCSDKEKEARVLAEKDLHNPFNLEVGPLVRFTLIKLVDEKNLLLFNMHHIISDGWSMGIFINEFLISYNSFKDGNTPELAPLRIHYKDYSVWQNRLLKSREMDQQRDYWLEKLAGELPVLDLPADNIRPVIQTFNGNNIGFVLPGETNSGLNDLCLESKASLFMMLQAFVKVLLNRYTGQTDIILGSPIAGRVHEDLENQIGFYVNTLCLRDTIECDLTFKEILASVKKTCTDAFDNQDYPFDSLVEDLDIKRDISRSPLFDVMVVLQNNETTTVEFDGLNLSPYNTDNTISKFDMTFNFSETGEGLFCGIEYNTDIYSVDRIKRMVEHLEILILSVLDNPESRIKDLEIIPADEKNLLLNVFNDSKTDYPSDKTIVDLFEEQVRKTPDNIAVVFEDVELTYKELNEKANIVGHYLRNNYDIKPDEFVGVFLDRSEKMIIAILGILKSGAAYVPIDPEYPKGRIDYMLEDFNPKVVLSEKEGELLLDINIILDKALNKENLEKITNSENLAYVIYTSGSTGMPKGTLIEHKNVVRLLFNDNFQFNFSARDVWTIFHSFCFDFSVWEMYGALLYGGKAVVVPKEIARDPAEFSTLLEKQNVTILNQTPTAFNNLSEIVMEQNQNLSVRYLIFGGEALNPSKLRFWHDTLTDCKIINMFGITETTVHVTYKEITEFEISNNISNLGKPIATLSTYVLDSNQKLLPIGVPGELCVAGDGVCRGYLNRDDLTIKKFVNNPFNKDERLYRSGDSAYITEVGELIYLGRIDNQVQLRGFRIELSEIENVLAQHNEISSAVVVAKEDIKGDKQLIAYYVSDKELELSELRSFLSKSLPDYMVPSYFVLMETLPLTPNGKIDRKALPEVNGSISSGVEYVAPRNKSEEKLVVIWQEVLGIKKIGVHDNFFNLGGHSLKAIKLISNINKIFDYQLQLREIFEKSTVSDLAELIGSGSISKEETILVPIQPNGSKKPIFLVPGSMGDVLCFSPLSQSLGEDQPVYGLQSVGLDGISKPIDSIEKMAELYIQSIKSIQGDGPYIVGGHSFGGLLAFEMCRKLDSLGDEIESFMLFDSYPNNISEEESFNEQDQFLSFLSQISVLYDIVLEIDIDELIEKNEEDRWICIGELLENNEISLPIKMIKGKWNVHRTNCTIRSTPETQLDLDNVLLFKAKDGGFQKDDFGWSNYISSEIKNYEISGNHFTMLEKPNVKGITDVIMSLEKQKTLIK